MSDADLVHVGMGSTLNHQGTAGFSPSFHLTGFHLWYLFLTRSQSVASRHYALVKILAKDPLNGFPENTRTLAPNGRGSTPMGAHFGW